MIKKIEILVYAWHPEKRSITLIELYHKNEKEVEDRQRILKNFMD